MERGKTKHSPDLQELSAGTMVYSRAQQTMAQVWLNACSVRKVLLEQSCTYTLSMAALVLKHATLSSCNRDFTGLQSLKCYLTLYKECSPIPDIQQIETLRKQYLLGEVTLSQGA